MATPREPLTHHEEEHGVVAGGVHNYDPDGQDLKSAIGSVSDVVMQAKRLQRRLFKPRRLKQYFRGQELYRTEKPRPIETDELFLDLIIVANIAAIGHELRETFAGWFEIEKFFLLFTAILSVWRSVLLYWNLFGSEKDVYDKLFVWLVFTLLTFIGAGAHNAFDKALPYVALASFFGTLIPWILTAYFSYKEDLLNSKQNIVNHGLLTAGVQCLTAVPYFIATFVSSSRVAKILFWIPPLLQIISSTVVFKLFRFIHRKPGLENRTTFAVHIDLMIEKYEVLTLIVLGESLLAILFEAAKFLSKENARVGLMYGAVVCATLIMASFLIFYVNVDNRILKGSTHAIRYNAFYGLIWSYIHIIYHACLLFFATAIGIMLRDILIDPSRNNAVTRGTEQIVHVAVRAGETVKSVGAEFAVGSIARWLFAGGWGGTLLLSGILALTHGPGPRDVTKKFRLAVRVVIVVGISIGMPYARISASVHLMIHSLVTLLLAVVEFMLVNADSFYLFKKHARKNSDDRSDSFDDDDDEDDEDIKDVPDAGDHVPLPDEEAASADPEAVTARLNECRASKAIRKRLKSRHAKNRLVKVDTSSQKICSELN